MRTSLLAAAATAALALAACSSSGGSSSSTPPAASTPASTAASSAASSAASASGGVVISGFAYSGTLTVKAGQKVTVTNKDSAPHTVTDKVGHKFDSGTISPGGSGTFTAPTTPGTYTFGCTIHPSMKGTLVVTG